MALFHILRRILSLVQIALLLCATSCLPPAGFFGPGGRPVAGLPRYLEPTVLDVPGPAQVVTAGGNLMVERVDLHLDTRIAADFEFGATYNSAHGRWQWSFLIVYAEGLFVDDTGAQYPTHEVADGEVVPGSHWVKLDANRMMTLGGRVFEFEDGLLRAIHKRGAAYPRLRFDLTWQGGQRRPTGVWDCLDFDADAANDCDWVAFIQYDPAGRPIHLRTRGPLEEVDVWDPYCWCVAPGFTVERQAHALFEYAGDRLVSARDGKDVADGAAGWRYEYAGGELSATISSEGERVEYAYLDGRIAQITQVGEQDPVSTFAYGFTDGRYWTLARNPHGESCTFRYDEVGRLSEMESAVGELVAMTWEGFAPASRNERGRLTTWSRSPNTVVETTPSGNQITTISTLDATNPRSLFEPAPLTVSDSLGLLATYAYDAAGRVSAVANGEGEVWTVGYDPDGLLAQIVTPWGLTTSYADHHVTGRPGSATRGLVSETMSYDGMGNQLTGVNFGQVDDPGRPGIERRFFDADRNLVRLRMTGHYDYHFYSQANIDIEYRSDRKKTAIHRPGGGDTRFEYDELGRLVARHEVADGSEQLALSLGYDAVGNLLFTERSNGMRREWAHDAVNRPVLETHLRNGAVERSMSLSWANGRVASSQDSTYGYGLEQFFYDAAGEPVLIQHPNGGSDHTYLVRDLRGRITQQHLLRGGSSWGLLEADYDLADRKTSLRFNGEMLTHYMYTNGLLEELAHGNGNVRYFAYDASDAGLEEVVTTNYLGEILEQTRHVSGGCALPDQFGCFNAFTVLYGDPSIAGPSSESYLFGPVQYGSSLFPEVGPRVIARNIAEDGSSELVHHAGLESDPGNRSFDFDVLNNLVAEGSFGFHDYNAEGNRLLSTGSRSFSYDEAGFATERIDSQGSLELSYNAAGLPTAVGDLVSWTWDARGRLAAATSAEQDRVYLYGGVVPADAATATPLSLDLGDVRLDFATGQKFYRSFDFRGNVAFVADETGEIVKRYVYRAFGVHEERGDDEADDKSFARGSQIGADAEETGLLLLGVRIYDSIAKRFLSPDPVLQVINQYDYAGYNSLQLWDHDGRQAGQVGATQGSMSVGEATMALLVGSGSSAAIGMAIGEATLVAGIVSGAFIGLAIVLLFAGLFLILYAIVGSEFSGAGAIIGGGFGGCSPSELGSPKHSGAALRILVPLQILLGCLLLRRRRRAGLRPIVSGSVRS